MRDIRHNPEGESDPANDVRRRCKKNSPSVLSCIRGQKKVTVAAKLEEFTAGEAGRASSCLTFAMTGANRLGTSAKGSVASVLANESASSIPGAHWKLRAMREKREPERAQRSQNFVGETTELCKEGQEPIKSLFGKGPIERGVSQDGATDSAEKLDENGPVE